MTRSGIGSSLEFSSFLFVFIFLATFSFGVTDSVREMGYMHGLRSTFISRPQAGTGGRG